MQMLTTEKYIILLMRYVHDNNQKKYCLRSKEIDGRYFSGLYKYCSVVVITIMFLCFDVCNF